MKSFLKMIWNIFAVFGILSLAGMVAGGFYLYKSRGGAGVKALGAKVITTSGVSPKVVRKLIHPPSARPGNIRFPDPGDANWTGHGARPDRQLSPVVYYNGRQPIPLPWYRFAQLSPITIQKKRRMVNVSDAKGVLTAIKTAEPGDVITLSPGVYPISAWSVQVKKGGTPGLPVTVRAGKLGDVKIEFDTFEGFVIDAPFLIFENLDIKGVRENHDKGEHAFHVLGRGKGFVLRNSRVHEFNSMIKANGTPQPDGSRTYPDNALIQDSSFYNSTVRRTAKPVTFIDVVDGNGWIIRGNLICDFAKGLGNQISYAAFIKGNARGGVFENNLVVGEYMTRGGTRVGLSFGGGGTGAKHARDQKLPAEHTGGIMRNNLIMYCNDVGIYLNKAADTKIYNNTLYRTMGIDIRFKESSAVLKNNLSTSRFKNRDGGTSTRENNLVADFSKWFKNPASGDFSLVDGDKIINRADLLPEIYEDACGNPRDNVPDMGALEYDVPPCTMIGAN
ncbi:MAG: right-handed parallel beta-helix repeat-containing protein [Desulfobacterales bacterium]|nr:right-handed parallel beta-helix repeat-containing protein [Desulfobacterales bacterium]